MRQIDVERKIVRPDLPVEEKTPNPHRGNKQDESYLDMSYSKSRDNRSLKKTMRGGNTTLNDREDEQAFSSTRKASYNYGRVDRTGQTKAECQYSQSLLKSLEMKTMKPMMSEYQQMYANNESIIQQTESSRKVTEESAVRKNKHRDDSEEKDDEQKGTFS